MKKRVPPPPQKTLAAYRQLWRIVDAAVGEAFKAHPDYLTSKGMHSNAARRSINKRVVGAVIGYGMEVSKRRSGGSPAAEK